jgi:hypothetical protein
MASRFRTKTIQKSLRNGMVAALTGMTSIGFAQEKQPVSDRFFLTIAETEPTKTEQGDANQGKAVVGIAEPTGKEPLSLSPLVTPNLALKGITEQVPEDLMEGRLPPIQSMPSGPDRPYGMYQSLKTWSAPVFCHQPLYFEDAMLERHGQERFPHLTPLISGARFFTGVVTKPYMVYLHPPLQDVPNTGHFRPGSPAPAIRERAPYDKGALRFQLLTTGATLVAIQP